MTTIPPVSEEQVRTAEAAIQAATSPEERREAYRHWLSLASLRAKQLRQGVGK